MEIEARFNLTRQVPGHGCEVVSRERRTELLKAHWTTPDRQIETPVVVADPLLEAA